MKVVVQSEPLSPYQAVEAYQQESIRAGSYGAAVTFVGVMRDFNDGADASAMHLEHYPGMTEKQIEQVCTEALEKWPIDDALVIHRVGDITPNDPIVLVAVWSAHRAEAFDACRYIINYLKQRAPFWKQEKSGQKTQWVAGNTEDSGVKSGE